MTATPMLGSTFFGLDISQFAARLLSIRRKISRRVLVLEFGSDFLLLAEATLTHSGVQLSHISSFSLPPEALDRGVPAEPLKMAGLIQTFCSEKKIPAHRVAVVVPPELAFQRLLDLPASLTTDEAREYVLNPANGLQIPFPLTQTDFDLFPVLMPVEQQAGDKRLYMLTAIPEVLVDPIVEMLQAADLELQLLELGSHSQLRNHAAELVTLAPQQVDLVLELLPDLDLRVLVADLRASLERFHLKHPGAEIRRVIVTGLNSSHPLLADLLAETLSLPVVLSCSTAVTGLSGLSMDDLLLRAGLGRLTGLSLGLLPSDQLLACSLEGHVSDGQAFQHQNDAVAIADLLRSAEAQTGLDLVAVEASHVGLIAEETNADKSVPTMTATAEVVASLDSNVELKPDSLKDVAERPDPSLVSQKQSTESDELTTGLPMPENFSEESPEIVVGETLLDASSEDAWPSIASSDTQYVPDIDVLNDADLSEKQWPSIANLNDSVGDENQLVMENGVSDDFSMDVPSSSSETSSNEEVAQTETVWPSIASAELTDEALVEEEVVKVDESEWSSSSADPAQQIIACSVPSDDPESFIQNDENSSKVNGADSVLPLNNSLVQPDSRQLSTVEDSDSGMVSTESTSDHISRSVIPDLDLMPETEDDYDKTDFKPTVSEDANTTDVLQGLGELRFAEDD